MTPMKISLNQSIFNLMIYLEIFYNEMSICLPYTYILVAINIIFYSQCSNAFLGRRVNWIM